jgi:hypothetical protein
MKGKAAINYAWRNPMVVRGHVKNGVVVLEEGANLPEGQEVTVHSPRSLKQGSHSLLDIPPVSVGAILKPLTSDDDLLGEMLEGRLDAAPEGGS